MPKQLWNVRRDENAIQYHFFVSHVGEDASEVKSLKAEIEAYSGRGGRKGFDCFLDFHNWPLGRLGGEIIREYLLKSAHMVAWITPDYLRNSRGWVWMELAYAELIEMTMNKGSFDRQFPYIVPVFRNTVVTDLERTPWQRLVDFFEQEERDRTA